MVGLTHKDLSLTPGTDKDDEFIDAPDVRTESINQTPTLTSRHVFLPRTYLAVSALLHYANHPRVCSAENKNI